MATVAKMGRARRSGGYRYHSHKSITPVLKNNPLAFRIRCVLAGGRAGGKMGGLTFADIVGMTNTNSFKLVAIQFGRRRHEKRRISSPMCHSRFTMHMHASLS